MAANSPYVVSYAAPTTIGELRYWCENEYERISVVFSNLAETVSGDLDARYFRKAGDTWDLGALQVFPKDPLAVDSSDAEMGFINFFGINALRIQALESNTDLGIGYLLLTGPQNVPDTFFVMSRYDGARVRNQIYRDDPTITDPQDPNVYEPDSIVTVDYALNKFVTSDTPTFTGIATFNNDGSPAGGIVVNGSVLGVGINCSSLILGNGFNANGQRGVNFADPQNPQDVATKAYADSIGGGGLPPGPVDGATLRYNSSGTAWEGISGITFTASGQATFGGGTAGGVIITGSGAGFSLDATGIILGRAGFNANNQKMVALAPGTSGTDAVNVNQLNGKANVSHTHPISDISGLQTELDAKAPVSTTVTLNTSQTVSAAKIFSNNIGINGVLTCSVGANFQAGCLMGNSRVQSVGAPVVGPDAANKTYVDGAVSDARLKKYVSDDVESERLHQLRIVSYEYDLGDLHINKPCFRDGIHYGVLTQEARKVMPEAVHESVFEGYDTFDYEMLVPLLVKEVQRMHKEIVQLKQQITGGQ